MRQIILIENNDVLTQFMEIIHDDTAVKIIKKLEDETGGWGICIEIDDSQISQKKLLRIAEFCANRR